MDRKLINPQIVSDIADAIRAKKGTSSPIVVSDLATEIASIQSMPQSTKDLATLVGGSTATDEISTNNDFAKGLTDTPSEYKFKEQVTASGGSIKDTIAFVDKVKGNCVKYNQLLNLVNGTQTDNGVTLTKNNGKIILSGTCTGSSNFSLMGAMPIVVGHKYLIWDKGQTYPISTTNEASLQLYGSGVIQTQIYERGSVNYAIGTATASGNAQLRHRVQNGNTYNLASEPMIVDLTELGMESATPTDIVSYLGYQSETDVPVMAYQPTTIVLKNNNKSICSKNSNNVVLDNLLISVENDIFPNGMQSNGTTRDEWDLAKGIIIKRIADDGTILATPVTHNVTKVKAYYKVSANGKEIAVSESLSAPLVADIAYRGMSAEDLINAING